jgi:hypothetical protein
MRRWICKVFGHFWSYPGGRDWTHDDAVRAICACCGEQEIHVMKLGNRRK